MVKLVKNTAWRCLAIALGGRRRLPGVVHPGWVTKTSTGLHSAMIPGAQLVFINSPTANSPVTTCFRQACHTDTGISSHHAGCSTPVLQLFASCYMHSINSCPSYGCRTWWEGRKSRRDATRLGACLRSYSTFHYHLRSYACRLGLRVDRQ